MLVGRLPPHLHILLLTQGGLGKGGPFPCLLGVCVLCIQVREVKLLFPHG